MAVQESTHDAVTKPKISPEIHNLLDGIQKLQADYLCCHLQKIKPTGGVLKKIYFCSNRAHESWNSCINREVECVQENKRCSQLHAEARSRTHTRKEKSFFLSSSCFSLMTVNNPEKQEQRCERGGKGHDQTCSMCECVCHTNVSLNLFPAVQAVDSVERTSEEMTLEDWWVMREGVNGPDSQVSFLRRPSPSHSLPPSASLFTSSRSAFSPHCHSPSAA